MSQQSEEEGAQHTSLGGPCVQCDGAGCVTADPYCPTKQKGSNCIFGQKLVIIFMTFKASFVM